MAIYMWRERVPRTFTISWEEKSDMSSWWTYSDDAAWLTAGDGAFDDFFWYSAVLLDNNWNETAEMTQSWWVFTWAMTTLGNITSWDNVMIKFPVRWIKMTKSGSVVTLSITEDPNGEGYQYYAFNSNWTQKDTLYLWAYKWTNSWWYLRSWSWTSSIWSIPLDTATKAANYYQTWYHEETWYARQYINALYMMKYWNPNSQSVVWNWYVSWSSIQATGATNSITNATWATNTSTTWRIKLFWLEDWWGNVYEWLDWAYYSSSTNLQTSSTQAFNSYSSTAANNKISTFDKNITVASWWISSIAWTNDWLFAWNTASWNASTYYCDNFDVYSGCRLLAGGRWNEWYSAGAFRMWWNGADSTVSSMGTRLMYL